MKIEWGPDGAVMLSGRLDATQISAAEAFLAKAQGR